jgi:hypothetical protein
MLQPIEQQQLDNNFIALRTVGDMLYAEFQNGTNGNVDCARCVCPPSPRGAPVPTCTIISLSVVMPALCSYKACLHGRPDHYELFDLATDKWQIRNLYPSVDTSTTAALHQEVQAWLHCRESSCP